MRLAHDLALLHSKYQILSAINYFKNSSLFFCEQQKHFILHNNLYSINAPIQLLQQ